MQDTLTDYSTSNNCKFNAVLHCKCLPINDWPKLHDGPFNEIPADGDLIDFSLVLFYSSRFHSSFEYRLNEHGISLPGTPYTRLKVVNGIFAT